MEPKPFEDRTARVAARLNSLTETAADMFLDQGYDAVSLDDLISRDGGSRRNIYQHFGGKEGLFIAAVTRLCEEIAEPVAALDIDHKDARTALTDFGRKLLELVLQPRALALHRLMIAQGHRFPDLSQAIWHAGHDNAARILAGWIDRRAPGDFHGDADARALATQFVSLLVTGPQLQALVGLQPRAAATVLIHGEYAHAATP